MAIASSAKTNSDQSRRTVWWAARGSLNSPIDRNLRRYADDGVGLFAMDLKTTGQLIGDCGIIRQHVENELLIRSDITCAAIIGAKASPPKPPPRAAIGLSPT